ncbi:uncharacterized protein V6R79_023536 [Siganus canaliculatus]
MAAGRLLTWMFCLDRDALPLSHPRHGQPHPGQAGPPLTPPWFSLQAAPVSASDLRHVSPWGPAANTSDATHPSWEVIPNHDEELVPPPPHTHPPVGSWLRLELEKVSTVGDGGWKQQTGVGLFTIKSK